MSVRLLAGLVGSLVFLFVGCGGDEDSGGTAAVKVIGKERTSTPAQYAERATRRCTAYGRRISEDLRAFLNRRDKGEANVGSVAAESMAEVLLLGFRAQYERLRELWPPRGDEDFLDLMLSTFSRSLEDGEEDLTRFFRVKASGYSEFGEATVMMREYRIRGCGSYRRSPEAILLDF